MVTRETFADLADVARHLAVDFHKLEYCDYGRLIRYRDTQEWVARRNRDNRWEIIDATAPA